MFVLSIRDCYTVFIPIILQLFILEAWFKIHFFPSKLTVWWKRKFHKCYFSLYQFCIKCNCFWYSQLRKFFITKLYENHIWSRAFYIAKCAICRMNTVLNIPCVQINSNTQTCDIYSKFGISNSVTWSLSLICFKVTIHDQIDINCNIWLYFLRK